MIKLSEIKIFEEKKVRTLWDSEKEKWYFSIIDTIEILGGTDRARKYWSDLKAKLKKEGSELSEKIGQLKMPSADNKFYKIDVADTEQLFRLMLAEASTKDISAATNPGTFEDSKKVAKQGGTVAKVARKELEARTGKKVVTSINAKSALQLQSPETKKKKNIPTK